MIITLGSSNGASSQCRRHDTSRAFTLVELLLALTLTTLLVTAIGRIAVGTLTTRRRAQDIVSRVERRAYVFDRIGDDFDDLLNNSAEPAIMVFGIPRQVLQLTVLAACDTDRHALHLVRRPSTVRYRLVDDRLNTEGRTLIREVIDLTAYGGKPLRETVATGVAEFGIEVLVRATWKNHYPDARAPDESIRAMRVTLRWLDKPETATGTFLPPEVSP